jgi:putative glycosyltransferase (TIGR04372 family)
MGHIVEKPIDYSHERVIDYATHHRSDFGDIYLLAKCKFFLGSNSGLATVPLIFNRPVALTNVIDATGPATGSRDLTIFKRLWLIEKKRFMTFREVIRWGVWTYGRHKQFAEARIEVIENSADEVLALAQEMNERLDGTWIGKDEDEELQARFRSLLPPGFPWNGFPGRIGAEFLRENRQLLD